MSLSRRRFFASAFTAGAAGLVPNLAQALAQLQTAPQEDLLVLENGTALVGIDRATGCVARLESKDGAWKIQGAGMRLHVPAPDHRYHFLTEAHTGKPRIESDKISATITWSAFTSARMGKLDIEVEQTVTPRAQK